MDAQGPAPKKPDTPYAAATDIDQSYGLSQSAQLHSAGMTVETFLQDGFVMRLKEYQ